MPKDKKKRRPRALPKACLCGSGKDYSACCKPLHAGARPASDAVELMRSRFTAFCLGLPEYLWDTLHSQNEASVQGKDAYCAKIARAPQTMQKCTLRVLDTREPDAHGVAQVLFYADIAVHKRSRAFVEQATFVQENGEWRYIAGHARAASELGHGLADLTIDHWDCGHHHH